MKRPVMVLVALLLAVGSASADRVTATVPVGNHPAGVAVNPVTNRIYVGSRGTHNVSVIDGATGAVVAVIPAGSGTGQGAVNPVTNRVYISNHYGNSVTVIDGAADTVVAEVAVGTTPAGLAVNAVTDKVYVPNHESDNVTVIDGATNGTTTVPAGSRPSHVAVNPVTDRIYVTNQNSNSVTVIDGPTNGTTTVGVGSYPRGVAVNPVTNRIYVANRQGNSVTVIDGATNGTTTVATGSEPERVGVNPVTNRVYVANTAGNSVTVIDGATNSVLATVPTGSLPFALAINPVTSKVYVTNREGQSVTVIDGATYATTTVPVGRAPWSLALNPVTNRVYVANDEDHSVTVIDGASIAKASVAANSQPYAVAVNPVTNWVYVANRNSASVTAIDGATNLTTTVPAGTTPSAVAVNPTTNRVYVANFGSHDVTVIDGAANTREATVPAGNHPVDLAVNPVTNRVYVANGLGNSATVIDGATNSVVATVAAGSEPWAIAVNPATNRVYVANHAGNSVTVIDGATHATTTVAAGNGPYDVAVNPATNRVYVPNWYGDNVTVIDGATNATTAVAAGSRPNFVAVDPVTNRVYVSNRGSHNVTVIDGATNETTTVAAGSAPRAVAVDPVTNRVYVASLNNDNLTVIDGASNATTTVATGARPWAVEVNPVTGKVYVANRNSQNVTVVTQGPVHDTRVAAAFLSDPNRATVYRQPALAGKAVNRQEPGRTAMHRAFTRLATVHRGWSETATTGGAGTDSLTWEWQWGEDSLGWGENLLCVLPLDLGTGTTNNLGLGTPFTGNLLVRPMYRVYLAPAVPRLVAPQDQAAGQPRSGMLVWEPAEYADGYDVYLDEVHPPVGRVSENQPGAAYAYSGLDFGKTYYWRVAARNPHGSAESEVWSFTTAAEPQFPPGWAEVRSLPASGGRRDAVRRGGFLATGLARSDTAGAFGPGSRAGGPGEKERPASPSGGFPAQSAGEIPVVYATKGNRLQVFQRYEPTGDTWARLADVPLQGRPLERGTRGVYAPGPEEGDGMLYLVYGNNTDAFLGFDPETDAWRQLPPVPPGRSGRRVRGGGDLVRVGGHLYLLKGDRTDFLRYDIEAGRWEERRDAPGIRFRRDSWLAVDDAGIIYLHQARNHGLWKYDPVADTWSGLLPGMPLTGEHGGRQRNKRARDGSAAAVGADGRVYALKGGNTTMFYAFEPGSGAWAEQPGMPREGTSPKPRRAGPGADITHFGGNVFFALKGNRTNEFWRYVVPAGQAARVPGPGKSLAGAEPGAERYLVVGPNPLAGGSATVLFGPGGTGPVRVTIFDLAGRSVPAARTDRTRAAGSLTLDLRALANGVYLVQVEAGDFSGTRKLVVQR